MFEGMHIELTVLYQTAEIPQVGFGCKVCKKVLVKGGYLLGLKLAGHPSEERYLIAARESVLCCGVEQLVPRCYQTIEEARTAAHNLHQHFEFGRSAEEIEFLDGSMFNF